MSMAAKARRKHVPQRTCIVCHDKRDKRFLVRLVKTVEGLTIDPTGKLAGRGAYLCDRATCWEQAIHGPALGNALRSALTDADRKYLKEARP